MRPPISFVYGNCVFASAPGDAWAAFVAGTHTYDALPDAQKRLRFSALLGALETVEADVQILRVSRRWNAAGYAESLARETERSHGELARRYLDAHARHLDLCAPRRPEVFILVRLRDPEPDVASFVSRALEQRPGTALSALRRAVLKFDRRPLPARELERVRARADRVHARLASFIEVRPARSAEIQWLVRRAFCRGLGEPVVDGLHEPRALVFESGGEALLAPLEGDVVRWLDSYLEHRRSSLRIESELGVSWQAHLVAGALPERASFPGARLELMFAPAEALPTGIDLALCARYLPNQLALRLARRRVQDADQILQAESDGEQGASDQGYERTQQARDLLSYLQSSSRPPLLRETLAIAVAAADEEVLEERVELCRRANGEVRLHRPSVISSSSSASTCRRRRRVWSATTTRSRASRWRR